MHNVSVDRRYAGFVCSQVSLNNCLCEFILCEFSSIIFRCIYVAMYTCTYVHMSVMIYVCSFTVFMRVYNSRVTCAWFRFGFAFGFVSKQLAT